LCHAISCAVLFLVPCCFLCHAISCAMLFLVPWYFLCRSVSYAILFLRRVHFSLEKNKIKALKLWQLISLWSDATHFAKPYYPQLQQYVIRPCLKQRNIYRDVWLATVLVRLRWSSRQTAVCYVTWQLSCECLHLWADCNVGRGWLCCRLCCIVLYCAVNCAVDCAVGLL
jgi:hypothetical protein